jgi:UDP-N-acetylmuramate dehydrogenase
MQSILQEKTLKTSNAFSISKNVPLADKNWFTTGGPAKFYAGPTSAQEFIESLTFARSHNQSIFILGQGANILISDDGFDGIVIRPQLLDLKIEHFDATHVLVHAGAGVTMPDLITYCLNNNIIGLEEFSGIPGTVGGSVYINLHYFEFLLEQFLYNAQIIHKETNTLEQVSPNWFKFGYNQSTLLDERHYLVHATFKLKKATDLQTAYAKGRSTEIIRHRFQRYPRSHTCGSFFRNFHEDEVTLQSNGKKIIFVAYYLDKIGVKGQLSVGDAIVSHQHANMIVNRGKATSNDIINLARIMQELVQKQFNLTPQPECRLIGFKDYPLLS